MSMVRYYTPENTLAKAIAQPGGKRVDAAVQDAGSALAETASACLETVDAALARLNAACDGVPAPERLPTLYQDAREVAGLAAVCGLPDLGSAALSFCALLDRAQDGGRLTARHMQVYRNVLHNLRRLGPCGEADSSLVLQNLDVMVARLSAREAEAAA